MKNALYAVLIAVLLLAVPLDAALAFVTPVTSEKGKGLLGKMGGDLAPIAARFNCGEFAWANFIDNGKIAALVYVPKGADFKTAARKVSMTVYALPGKAEEDKKVMTSLAQSLIAGFQKNGKIVKQDVFHNAKDEPGMFIEYTLAAGDKKEYSAKEYGAGVFVRLTAYTAAFIQLQSSGKALNADDIVKVKSLIAGDAAAKAKAAPAKKG